MPMPLRYHAMVMTVSCYIMLHAGLFPYDIMLRVGLPYDLMLREEMLCTT